MADEQRESDSDTEELNNRKRREKGKAKVEELTDISDHDDQSRAAADHSSGILLDDSPTKKRRINEQGLAMDQIVNRLSNVAILNDTPNPLRPGSRVMSADKLILEKILDGEDVLPESPILLLDLEDASILADKPEFAFDPPTSYQKTLLAFDEYDRQFNLLFTIHKDNQDCFHFQLTGGWGVFVNMHKLKGGDEIVFYQYKDARVSNDYYYALRYFRKPKPKPVKPVIVFKKKTGGADDDKQKRTGGANDDKQKGAKVVVGHWG